MTTPRNRSFGWVRRFISADGVRWKPVRLSIHIAIMLVLAGGIAVQVWFCFGAPRLGGPYNESQRLDVIKIILAITGGLGGVVFLTVAYRRQQLGEAAKHRLDSAEDRESTRLLNERFGAAADQLGSDHAAVRLAGAYAMASLADDWQNGRQQCINVLCAYIRMPYLPPAGYPRESQKEWAYQDLPGREHIEQHQDVLQERQVRRSILDLIGQRLRAEPVEGQTWHGHDFDFSGAVIDGGDFSGAKITGGSILFSQAVFLRGRTTFKKLELTGGCLNFVQATVTGGALLNFTGAHFRAGNMMFAYAKFKAGEVWFRHSWFGACDIDFREATFSGPIVLFGDIHLNRTSIYFNGASLVGAIVSFTDIRAVDQEERAPTVESGQIDFSNAKFEMGVVNFYRAQCVRGNTIDMSKIFEASRPPQFLSGVDSKDSPMTLPEQWPPATASDESEAERNG